MSKTKAKELLGNPGGFKFVFIGNYGRACLAFRISFCEARESKISKHMDFVPGNSSDQFCSNKISVLLCEGPTPRNSMISGFLSPGKLLFMDFIIPNYFKQYKKIWTHF